MKITYLFLLISLLNTSIIIAQSDLAEWPLTANLNPVIMVQGLNASVLVFSPSSSAIAYSSSYGAGIGGWALSSSLDTSCFYQIAISPSQGNRLSISSLQFSERRTTSCIRKFKVMCSSDRNFTSSIILMDDSFYVSNPSYQSLRSHDLTGIDMIVSGNDTLYFRFYGYYSLSSGSSTRWYLKNIIISGDVINNNNNDFTTTVDMPLNQVSAGTIGSLMNNPGQAIPVFRFRITDEWNSDTLPTIVTGLKLKNGNSTKWLQNIGGIILKDSSGSLIPMANALISDTNISIEFDSGDLIIENNSYKEITTLIFLQQAGISDDSIINFVIDSIDNGFEADTSGSGFINNLHHQIISSDFQLMVNATKLMQDTFMANPGVNQPFFCSFSATDIKGNKDIDGGGTITLSLVKGNGNLFSPSGLTKTFNNGVCTWSDLYYDIPDTFIIKAVLNNDNFNDSTMFTVIAGSIVPGLDESFSDGNFSCDPQWGGDTDLFIIDTSGGNYCLRLNDCRNPAGTTAYLYTHVNNSSENTQWEFYSKLSFNLSTYLKVYLLSDNENLNSSINGYFLKIYKQATSLYKTDLYRQEGTANYLLGSDTVPMSDNQELRMKIALRDTVNSKHEWKVSADLTGKNDFTQDIFSILDTSSMEYSSFYFGFVCKYSSTHKSDFYFDDIYIGPERIDTVTPKLVNVIMTDHSHVRLMFSRVVDSTYSDNIVNYNITGHSIHPYLAVTKKDTMSIVDIYFHYSFGPDTAYTLKITGIRDFNGNRAGDIYAVLFYHLVKPHDIEINEIMADPTNAAGLQDYEYIELFNRSAYPVDLNGWTLKRGTNDAQVLSDHSYILPADSFLIITSTSSSNPYLQYRFAIGLSSFSLLNGGEALILRDSKGEEISYINYSDSWYIPSSKDTGGWSLEQINPLDPCGESSNWRASCDIRGGTPGKQNSVYGISGNDNINPEILRITMIDSKTIKVIFSETIDSALASNHEIYNVDQGVGHPVSAIPDGPEFKEVKLIFNNNFVRKNIYNLQLTKAINDCAGNPLLLNSAPCRFGIGDSIVSQDVVINEVLFDPLPGGYDFIEIYNRSDKIIDLKDLYFKYKKYSTDTSELVSTVVRDGYLVFPGEYLVITESPQAVRNQYFTPNPRNFAIPDIMPALNIDYGAVKIITENNMIVDEFYYSQTMHFPLLTSTKGVSLERLSYNRDSNDPSNWHSAAQTVGFATPAYRNSEFQDDVIYNDMVKIEPEIFSPDDDGYNDILNIEYHLSEPGWVANVSIYDSEGRLEKSLMKNGLPGISGSLSWDGINEKNKKSPIGIYVLYFELYDLNKKIIKIKKPFVLAGKLN